MSYHFPTYTTNSYSFSILHNRAHLGVFLQLIALVALVVHPSRALGEQVHAHAAQYGAGDRMANFLSFEAWFQHGSGFDFVHLRFGHLEALVQRVSDEHLPFGHIFDGVHEHFGHVIPFDHTIRVKAGGVQATFSDALCCERNYRR